MKKFISIIILLFIFALFANGHDLLIRYDYVNKKTYYFKIKNTKDDKEKLVAIKRPRVGPNGNVKVEYVNMNPFIWKQPKANLLAVASDSVSSFNPFSMMLPGGLGSAFGSLDFGFTRDAAALNPQQMMCYSALRSLYEANDEINTIKYDYKLTKQEILDQTNQQIKRVVKNTYQATGMDTTKSEYQKADFASLRNYFKDVCQMEIPNSTRSADASKTDAFLADAGVGAGTRKLLPAEALNDIEQNYFTVSEADFKFENSFLVNDKDVVLHMDFKLTDDYLKKSSKDTIEAEKKIKEQQKVKDQSIFIPVTGGVRVSTSAGIGFTYLGGSRKTYYLEYDSVLAAVPDNSVIPVVGTFLNVYSRGLGVVNLGGSFGIFVSLQETFSINYMLGFTTVFGRKERLLLSLGCVMAPVEEPSKGYHVGTVTYDPDFPTKMSYKPGMFFCVHYNIGKF